MWKKKKEGKKQKREMKFETTELLLWGRKRKFYEKKKELKWQSGLKRVGLIW